MKSPHRILKGINNTYAATLSWDTGREHIIHICQLLEKNYSIRSRASHDRIKEDAIRTQYLHGILEGKILYTV